MAFHLSSVTLGLAILWTAVASAQTPPPPGESEAPDAPPPPAHISGASGTTQLEREGAVEEATSGMPLLVGDRVRTEAGTVDITWQDGSVLRLERYTEVDLLSTSMVRVPRGQLTVNVAPTPDAGLRLQVDAPGASVRFQREGEYRINVTGSNTPDVEVTVLRGAAELISDRGRVALADGELSRVFDGNAPESPERTTDTTSSRGASDDRPSYDRQWDGWNGSSSPSTDYLPNELYGYAPTFDSYGTWATDVTYGRVWYPRVAAGWRPYHHGRWHYVKRYGWTWIGFDRWAWATQHYGRWGVSHAGAWYWIPSRRWGPGWVSWAVSPSYVGWCPLGWNGRPLYGFSLNVHSGRRFDHWRAWTVLPSNRWAFHDAFRHHVDRRILLRDRPHFVSQRHAPPRDPWLRASRGDVAVPRSAGSMQPLPRGSMAPLPRGTMAPPPGVTNNNNYAVPRSFGGESPYERARRVADERDSRARGRGNDGVAPSADSRVPPFMRSPQRSPRVVAPGSRGNDDAAGGRAVPRSGIPSYTIPGARSAQPSRPSDPDTGAFRSPRRSPDSNRPPMEAMPMPRPAPRGGDDSPRAVPRGMNRPPAADRGSDRGDRGGSSAGVRRGPDRSGDSSPRSRGSSGEQRAGSRGDSGSSRGSSGVPRRNP